jgi:hypothetical protein
MRALQLYAGPGARAAIAKNGLQAGDICTIPAAAGGPKGLLLGPLDRFIFGTWLPQSGQPIDLVGASIGAWRMSTACLNDPVAALNRLEHDYVHQHYELPPGQKKVSAALVSEVFGKNLSAFYDQRVPEVLNHPRFRLHVLTSRGRHVLRTERGLRTAAGYLGAFLTNAVHRRAMGAWLERVVFSAKQAPLPFGTQDYRTRQVALTEANFNLALQASCSIPFVLKAVHNIPGAPAGAYWDGGITDYHLHLNYPGAKVAIKTEAVDAEGTSASGQNGIVLYPHFQKNIVPGWLDKSLKWRHGSTAFLDTMLVLAPRPEWVRTLPNAKIPDRTDFTHYGNDLAGRVKAWTAACSASQQLADEFAQWLQRPDPALVQPL